MAQFQIDENHRLKSDSRQWMLQKRGSDDKDGQEVWTGIRFYVSLEGAVKASYGYLQQALETDNMTDFINESNAILKSFSEIFAPEIRIEVVR